MVVLQRDLDVLLKAGKKWEWRWTLLDFLFFSADYKKEIESYLGQGTVFSKPESTCRRLLQ